MCKEARSLSAEGHHGSADHIPRRGLDLDVAVPGAAPDGPVQCRHPLHLELELDAALLQEEELLLVGPRGGKERCRGSCVRCWCVCLGGGGIGWSNDRCRRRCMRKRKRRASGSGSLGTGCVRLTIDGDAGSPSDGSSQVGFGSIEPSRGMAEGVHIVTSVGRHWPLQSYESPLLELAQKGLEAVDAQLGLERSGLWIGKCLDVVDGEVMTIWLERDTHGVMGVVAAILEDGH